MRKTALLISSAAMAAFLLSAPAEARHRHHHHGAGLGIALGAGVVLGALAAGAANSEPVYAEPPPPPPAFYEPPYDEGYGRQETRSGAIEACRDGLLAAGRKYGAIDAEVDEVISVRETPEGGHRVRAGVTMIYRDYERSSEVVCHTEGGWLVSANTDAD